MRLNETMEKRLGYVDALRGVAALAVIYAHSTAQFMLNGGLHYRVENEIAKFTLVYLDAGKVAVILFFAISGFVIPFSLFRETKAPLQSFAITRLFRLYPVYWLSIFVWVGYSYFSRGESTPAREVLVNLTMLQQFVGVRNVIELFWTLQIELVFYVLCAALFAGGWLRTPRHIAWASIVSLACALALAAARSFLDEKLPVALPLALSIMFWGFLWRRATVDHAPDARAWVARLTPLIYAAIPPISVMAYSTDHGFHETWWRYMNSYLLALTLFILFTTRIKIDAPSALFLGRISYSVYLFGPLGQELAMKAHPYLPKGAPALLAVALAMVLTLPISATTYRLVEKPAISMGKSLRRRLQDRRDALRPAPQREWNLDRARN